MNEWRTPQVSRVRPIVRLLNLEDDFSPSAPLEEGPLHTPSPLCPGGDSSTGIMSMEHKLEGLQAQVHSLTHMLETRLITTQPSVLAQENDRLKRVNAELGQRIRDSEARLTQLQESVVDLQEEYQLESEDLVKQVNELAATLQEEKLERLKLQHTHDKVCRSKRGLESYLTTLPSLEEHESLQAALKAEEEQCQTLKARLSQALQEVEDLAKSNRARASTVVELETQAEAKAQIARGLQDRLAQMEVQRQAAQEMNPMELESVLQAMDDIKIENQNLKRYVKILQNRHKRESTALHKTNDDLASKLEAKSQNLETVVGNLETEVKTSRYLRECLTNTKAKVIALEAKSEGLASDLDVLRCRSSYTKEQRHLLHQLHGEIGQSVRDLRVLGSVTNQILAGEDPNVTTLLGIRDMDHSPGVKDQMDLGLDQSVEYLRSQVATLRGVRMEIQEIRATISDKYADNIGSNMTSCITQ